MAVLAVVCFCSCAVLFVARCFDLRCRSICAVCCLMCYVSLPSFVLCCSKCFAVVGWCCFAYDLRFVIDNVVLLIVVCCFNQLLRCWFI